MRRTTNQNRPNAQRNTSNRPAASLAAATSLFEPLETRALFSSVSLGADGTLNIIGSDLADTIVCERSNIPQLGGDRIAVSLRNASESITRVFAGAQVKKIFVKCLGGNDSFKPLGTNVALSQPLVIYGGSGNDTLYGSTGNDLIYGDDGDDFIAGAAGNDTLYGAAGNDYMIGDEGNDMMYGGLGNDRLYGRAGNDSLAGGAGDDLLSGNEGDDMLDGGAGSDLLYGGDGNDFIFAGPRVGDGIDTLVGGAGNDTMVGCNGDDVFVDIESGKDIFARY